MTERRRVLVVGCGYVGTALAARLTAAGHVVFGLRRTAGGEPDPAGSFTLLTGDLTRPDTWRTLPGPFDWIVNTVSSARGGAAEYRQVFLEGTQVLLDWIRSHPPAAFAYTGSTSVYGQTDGAWVDESDATGPTTETGQLLVETEQSLLAAARDWGFPARILRVAGIYGPGRGHLFRSFLRGEARLEGDGSRWLNMIHRDDVAGALQAVLERGRSGQVYNAADLEPVQQGEFLRWLATETGLPLPPPVLSVETGRRKRGTTNKRVSVRKLGEETGWSPQFPTYREGYASELATWKAKQGIGRAGTAGR